MNRQRREWLQKAAAAGLLGTAGVCGLMREALAKGTAPVQPGLYRITGDVRLNGKAAAAGTLIKPGDVLETAANAEAIYVIGQDAYMQRANSRIEIGADLMRVVTGRILSVFAKGARRIETPAATIGIRGTGCYIEAEAERVYFCLCYGEAEVVPAADPKARETIRTYHHDHPIWIEKKPGMPTMSAAGVQNHNDDELILLEGLVGRLPPFYGSNSKY